MERAEKFGAAHAALLVLTIVFLGAVTFLSLRDESGAAPGEYTVRTERSADTEQLIPEKTDVNINTATAEELAQLMGIGPVLAQAIVDYRESHGPFASVEELLEVSGIGEAKLGRIREDVTIGGEGS